MYINTQVNTGKEIGRGEHDFHIRKSRFEYCNGIVVVLQYNLSFISTTLCHISWLIQHCYHVFYYPLHKSLNGKETMTIKFEQMTHKTHI